MRIVRVESREKLSFLGRDSQSSAVRGGLADSTEAVGLLASAWSV